jgi:hypothetical protein
MQLALEALEDANDVARMEFSDENYYSEAINALRQALEEKQEPVGNDRVMTVVYRNVQKEDAQSFTDHPKAVWFGWCHAPYQRDDAIFKLEKAITSPPASKPWVGLTDEEILECTIAAERNYAKHMQATRGQQLDQRDQLDWWIARCIEAKLKEKNYG